MGSNICDICGQWYKNCQCPHPSHINIVVNKEGVPVLTTFDFNKAEKYIHKNYKVYYLKIV